METLFQSSVQMDLVSIGNMMPMEMRFHANIQTTKIMDKIETSYYIDQQVCEQSGEDYYVVVESQYSERDAIQKILKTFGLWEQANEYILNMSKKTTCDANPTPFDIHFFESELNVLYRITNRYTFDDDGNEESFTNSIGEFRFSTYKNNELVFYRDSTGTRLDNRLSFYHKLQCSIHDLFERFPITHKLLQLL